MCIIGFREAKTEMSVCVFHQHANIEEKVLRNSDISKSPLIYEGHTKLTYIGHSGPYSEYIVG